MKKLLILMSAIVFASQFANAQTQKGTQTVGLDLTLGHNVTNNSNPINNDSRETNSFGIGPTYSYFIANGSEIGASVNYNTSSDKTTYSSSGSVVSTSKQTGYTYGASVFYRKYFLYQNLFGVRISPYAAFSKGENTNESSPIPTTPAKNETRNYNAGINVNLVFYPSSKIGLAASLGGLNYNYSKGTNEAGGKTTVDNLQFNFIDSGLTFAVFFVIGSK